MSSTAQVHSWEDMHGFICYALDAERVLKLGFCLGQLGRVLLHPSRTCVEGQSLKRKLGRNMQSMEHPSRWLKA